MMGIEAEKNELSGIALNEAISQALGMVPCDKWVELYGGWAAALIGDHPWRKGDYNHEHGKCYPEGNPTDWAGDDASATMLAREMQQRGYMVEINMHPEGGVYCTMVDYPSAGDSLRDSFAEAVARASLKALLEE